MGFFEDGLFGKVNGKVGNLVYYTRMGKNVVRSSGVNMVPPSEAQLSCRMEMGVTSRFTKTVKGFIQVAFAPEAQKEDKLVTNIANSVIKLNSLKGVYPNIEIDFTKLILSRGELKAADTPEVAIVAEGLSFSWKTDPHMEWPESTDQVMLLAYFSEESKSIYRVFGPDRLSGTALLEISAPLLSKPMETYISFISADRKRVSDSVYVGRLNG